MPAPGADTLRATICDVKAGGAIRLAGFGDDGEDVVLTINVLVPVRLGAEEWHEVAGEYRARLIRVEWRKRASGTRVIAYSRTDLPLAEVGLETGTLDAARAGSPPVAALGSTFRVEEAGDAIRGGALAGWKRGSSTTTRSAASSASSAPASRRLTRASAASSPPTRSRSSGSRH